MKIFAPIVKAGSFLSALWTFPSVIGSAIVIAWAAEVAQFIVSQGMALAILALLQTLPEFAVEAVIAWRQDIDLMTANFTGSNRLLVGVGWPMMFFVASYFNKKKTGRYLEEILLRKEYSVEIIALAIPTLYFFFIYHKGTLDIIDSLVLTSIYIFDIYLLGKLPPEGAHKVEHVSLIPKKILSKSKKFQIVSVVLMFFLGGIVLYFVAEPFLESMLALAMVFGISNFVFVQWVAPFLSEFPEKVTVFYWAKTVKLAPMALMNMISSKVNQWTVLVAMIPIVYSISIGKISYVPFNEMQKTEILLTIVQSIYAFLCLADLRFRKHEAFTIFGLWLVQFFVPSLREEIIYIYVLAILIELFLIKKDFFKFIIAFKEIMKKHVFHGN